MAAAHADLESSLLGFRQPPATAAGRRHRWTVAAPLLGILLLLVLLLAVEIIQSDRDGSENRRPVEQAARQRRRWGISAGRNSVESEVAVVAADDGRCSEVGAAVLKAGGHAVDAAVAAALCLGVVHPMSSGIGGGAFVVVRPAAEPSQAMAFDGRETAPAAATKNMYEKEPSSKVRGALSMGIPGELAGLHAAWLKYGRLPWKDLFQPAITLAREGFTVVPALAHALESSEKYVLADPGLRQVFAPKGKLLQSNETCYNHALSNTLEIISSEGPHAFYNGSIGEKFIEDVRSYGGIATMEDMRSYRVEVMEAMEADAMGYKILGMPPPSSGTLGMALVLNILGSYKSVDAVKGLLGLHRRIEALKHMIALRMNLGDPDFVDVDDYVSKMLSPSFAAEIQKKILDNTTFGPDYYMAKWGQVREHGTSHLCIVDSERNAVSMTTTVNGYFGAKVLSPETGVVLNNEMDDFSVPANATPDQLPPSPANFIEPRKRPLSSMTPVIILKDNQLAGVIGASGGTKIPPTVIEVFLNHFIKGVEPLEAVKQARVYPQLIPNKVLYENWTAMDGEFIGFNEKAKLFLEQRGHHLEIASSGAVCQLVVHDLSKHASYPRRTEISSNGHVLHGLLTAVSDPRKDGSPAGL